MTTYEYLGYDSTELCSKSLILNPNLMATIFYLVFSLGLLGNGTVLWILLRVMHMKSMTDVCLMNLAISDLLTVVSLPAWALYHQGHHFVSDGMCKFMAGTYHLGFYSGILFVTLLSIDRYLAIVHAVASLGARNLRYAVAASLIIWMVSFCATLPSIILNEAMDIENVTQCQWNYPQESAREWKLFLNFSQNIVGLFVSLPIIIYCYARILLVLRKTKNSKRGRAMKLVFAIVGAFVVFWVPYNISVFLQSLQNLGVNNTCEADQQITVAMDVTETISLVHCCVNPVIYAFVGEKFRRSLAKVFSKWLLCSKLYQTTAIYSKTSDNETSNTAL